MAEKAVNPYAPPEEDVGSTPPQTRLWCVMNGYLAVRHGAFLPPVDLEGDGSGGPLTPVVHHHAQKIRRGDGSPPVVKFRCFTSLASFQKRMKRRRLSMKMLFAGIILLLGGMATVRHGELIERNDHIADAGAAIISGGITAFLIGFLILLVVAVWDRRAKSVRCTAVRDGWFYLSGVSPRSLSLFSMRSHELPVMVERKAYRIFSHRLPLSFLIRGHRFNPLAILMIAVMKARRSPALESIHLHHSEEGRRPGTAGDPELLAQWEDETAGTEMATWKPVAAKTMLLPSGAMGIESLLFLSPDRSECASILINRISNGPYAATVRQSSLRSWTAEQCILTTTPPCLPVHSTWIDRLKSKGKLPTLLERHRAHIAGRELVSLENDDHLFALLAQESEEEYSAFQAAGFQSPIEIMELPEYPAAAKPRATPPPMPI